MFIQGVVPYTWDRHSVVSLGSVCQTDEKSGRIYTCVLGRPDQQLLVEYYQRQQHVERVEREPQQRQREQHEQDEQQLCLASSRWRMMALSPLLNCKHPLFSVENLYTAYKQCRRRKRGTYNALIFESNLEENLFALHEELNNGRYQPEPSMVFMVEKPKRREIFAASFRDRVVHHLLISHLEPRWERQFIHSSFACRRGKGTHKGVEKLQRFIRKATSNGTRTSWYLQLDVRGFFISIDRNILFDRVAVKEKDPVILWLIKTLIFYDPTNSCRFRNACQNDFLLLPDHKTLFKAGPECGLPIGNLTSQFFANVYLDALDQFVKHCLKVRYYVRYCDDFVLLSKNREELLVWKEAIRSFLQENLRLQLNEKQKLRPITDGIDFLGYIVRSNYLLVRRRVVGAIYERLNKVEHALVCQGMGLKSFGRMVFPWDWYLINQVQQWLTSYQGHLRHASSERLWNDLIHRFQWLDEYFVWEDRIPRSRYPSPRYVRRFSQQKRWFIDLLPDHVLMIRLGSFWEMSAGQPNLLPIPEWYGKRFPDRYIAKIKQFLWESGCLVAWIDETGRRTTEISERILVDRWDRV